METPEPVLEVDAFAVIQRWWQAWMEHDLHTLENMTADDYTEHSDTGALHTGGLSAISERVAGRADTLIDDWELSRPVTKKLEHLIVCSYAFRIAGTKGRERFAYEGWATDLLTRTAGQWRVLSHEGAFGTGSARS